MSSRKFSYCSTPQTSTRSWLKPSRTLRLEPEGVLAIHGPDRVPVEADMAGHRIGVAPSPLHRVAEMQAIAAGRSIERLDRLDGELGHPGLVAAAADAVGDRYLLARI